MRKQENIYSHLTAKERDSISFPARFLLKNKLFQGKILDFGCGLGSDVAILRGEGFDVLGYDPYYFPTFPTEKFDTIICFYVLNVLQPEEQANVLIDVSRLLKPSGTAYFAVRRDVVFEGFRLHKIHQKPTFQCQVKLAYKSIFKNESCEIYTYQHYNQTEHLPSDCPFCHLETDRELIAESATALAIFDKYAVSKGHSLVVPKRHTANYFDLTFKEQSALWFMVNRVKAILVDTFNPDGFNIGININAAAGQTVSHVHIHIIPRYDGDVENPTGGLRNVIAGKGVY